jgi:hypothetical protein
MINAASLSLVSFALAFSASPISAAAERPAKTVLVAVDLSTSTKDHRQDYLKYFRRILDTMGEGDKLLVAQIAERPSTAESLAMKPVEYATGGLMENEKRVRLTNLEASLNALRSFEALLAQTVEETPILEVLRGAPRLFDLYKNERLVLVLMSDMMEYSKGTANFESRRPPFAQKVGDDLLARLKKERRIANLGNVTVYVAGARELKEDSAMPQLATARREAVKSFWTAYFNASGAALAPSAYATDLLGFDVLECNVSGGKCSKGIFVSERDKQLKK